MLIPQHVQIELTNVCNNSCKYCPHRIMKRKQEFMTIENYRKILVKCKEEGVKIISPFLNGESALHPKFIEALRMTKEMGFVLYLFDNMSLIDKQISDTILEIFTEGDYLNMSLDTVNEETYKIVRGEGMLFGKTMENVDYFLDKFVEQKSKFMVGVQQIKCAETDNKLEIEFFIDYYSKWSGPNYKILSQAPMMNWAGVITSYKKTGAEENKSCIRLTRDMAILVNGDVALCCVDYEGIHKLGNIYEQSIEEIFNSKQYDKFRKEFPQGLCKECNARWQ